MATTTIQVLQPGDIKDANGNTPACGASFALATQLPTVIASNPTIKVSAIAAGSGVTAHTDYAIEVARSTDAGNIITVGTDGKLFAAATATFDDQVMTLTNTATITGTMTPSAPTGPDSQVNYTLAANVVVDSAAGNVLSATAGGLNVTPPDTLVFTNCAGTTIGSIKGWF